MDIALTYYIIRNDFYGIYKRVYFPPLIRFIASLDNRVFDIASVIIIFTVDEGDARDPSFFVL